MSGTHGDTFLESLENKYPFIKHLSLSYVYLLFSLKPMDYMHMSSPCEYLSSENDLDICNYSSICASVQAALLDLKDIVKNNILDNDSKWCEYLSYWIYSNMQNNKSCRNSEQLYKQLYELLNNLKEYYYYNTGYTCDIKEFSIDMEKFAKKKKLFFHAEILNWIEKDYNEIYIEDQSSYEKYLDECAHFFQEIKCKEDESMKEIYENELTNLENNFNNAISFLKQKNIIEAETEKSLKNKLICESQSTKDKGEDSEDRVKTAVESQPSSSDGLKRPLGEGQPGHQTKDSGKGLVESSSQPEGQPGLERSTSEPKGKPGLEKSNLGPEGQPGLGESSTLTEQYDMAAGHIRDDSESILPKNVSTVGATLAGSSLFLLMLYKYTPLGSWVSTRILGRNKLMENMRKNNYELLLNDVGNNEASLNDTMYHISYNSSSNQ